MDADCDPCGEGVSDASMGLLVRFYARWRILFLFFWGGGGVPRLCVRVSFARAASLR